MNKSSKYGSRALENAGGLLMSGDISTENTRERRNYHVRRNPDWLKSIKKTVRKIGKKIEKKKIEAKKDIWSLDQQLSAAMLFYMGL